MTFNDSTEFRRTPGVAGPNSFYPSDPFQLRNQVERYTNAADLIVDEPPFCLIAPHAGYVYSGPVAGWAYRQVLNREYDTVIVIAPSHVEAFPFAAILPSGVYETPLGDIQVDSVLAREIATAAGEVVGLSEKGHISVNTAQVEHSLEVQLPFLQVALGEFNLVPIVIGTSGWRISRRLGSAIARSVGDRDILVVASSDLSHYRSYESAYNIDREMIRLVEKGDAEAIANGCEKREVEACGGAPIATALHAGNLLGYKRTIVLRYATSGDVKGGLKDRVVGYMAAASYRGANIKGTPLDEILKETDAVGCGLDFTERERKDLLLLARISVESSVRNVPFKMDESIEITSNLLEKRGVFVTIRSGSVLRGCIGNLTPMEPLHELVVDVARQTALSDPRFNPIMASELGRINLEITVLGPMVKVKSPNEVIVGRHGLFIRYGGYQGLLLPQVAVEQNWNREKFLTNVCMKAGLQSDTWKNEDVELFIFTAEHFSEGS